METHEPIDHDPISREEASAALAAAKRSRTRVAWSGYPAWYWLTTGAGLGAVACSLVLPRWWDLAIVIPVASIIVGVVIAAGFAATGLILSTRAARP